MAMRPWKDLGIVDTIYEEDYEYSTSSSLSPTPSPSSPLHSRVEAWSIATGHETDVSIYVQGTRFDLHKDPLTSRSTYLRWHLTEVHELTLSPPLNLTAETFALVADFCYGSDIVITPFNVAALRTAAELLEMTETDGEKGEENLRQITETYFRRVIAVNGGEFASIVFLSCLALLPEAETEALMLSRCVEALSLRGDGDGDGDNDGIVMCVEELIKMRAEEFQIVAESMQRVTCHDVVYRIVDCYIKEQAGKITDDQKTQICNSIDCNRLSPDLIFHAVQNPRMPLRFVVRAMLVEQLNTRRSIFSTATAAVTTTTTTNQKPRRRRHPSDSSITLGAILQRDAAMRQAEQLKAAMDATSSRIHKLERELRGMKLLLLESEKEKNNLRNDNNSKTRSIMESVRSASFHYLPAAESNNNKIERGERRSVSFRFNSKERRSTAIAGSSTTSEESSYCINETTTPKTKKHIGKKLISGLKNAFKVSNSASKHESNKTSAKGSRKVDGADDQVRDFDDGDGARSRRFVM